MDENRTNFNNDSLRDSTNLNSRVKVIPAKVKNTMIYENHNENKKRVAVYARVSTEFEAQASSYELQVSYFTEYVQSNPAWELVNVYADSGISGTSTKNRTEFNRMIEDCKDGKIDYVITKSISRFARNTLDCLHYIRLLKNLPNPVGVFFQKENLDTLDSKSELFLTILSSMAQEESRSISENTKWGVQKRFQQGKAHCPTVNFLGYDTDENGNLIINEKEAEVVRRIYREFLEGKGSNVIANGLTKDGIPTVRKREKWTPDRITKIIKNEKYCGDILMQKSVTLDFLTHKRVINKGHQQQYFIKDHHPAIIPRDEWYAAQEESKRRYQMLHDPDKRYKQSYSGKCAFSNKFFCAECARPVIRRRLTSQRNGEKYLFAAWQCRAGAGDRRDSKDCNCRYIRELSLEVAFMKTLYELKKNKQVLIDDAKEAIASNGLSEIKNERLTDIDRQLSVIAKRLNEMAQSAMKKNSEIYEATVNQLLYEQDLLESERENFIDKKQETIAMERQLQVLIELLDTLEEEPENYEKYYEENKFRDDIFLQSVQCGFMHNDGKVDFEFKCGITRTTQAFIRVINKKAKE